MKTYRSSVYVCALALSLLPATLVGASQKSIVMEKPKLSSALVDHIRSSSDATSTVRVSFAPLFSNSLKDQSGSAMFTKDADGNERYFLGDKEVTYKAVEKLFEKERNLREIRTKNLMEYRKKILTSITKKYPDATGTYTVNVCRSSKRDYWTRFDFGFAVAVY